MRYRKVYSMGLCNDIYSEYTIGFENVGAQFIVPRINTK
jgi:hypothetical protein